MKSGSRNEHQRLLGEGIGHSRPVSLALAGSIPLPARALRRYWQARGLIPAADSPIPKLMSQCGTMR
ncbi:MAG: hypothetical protein ABI865_07175 [Nitrosospira sp.]